VTDLPGRRQHVRGQPRAAIGLRPREPRGCLFPRRGIGARNARPIFRSIEFQRQRLADLDEKWSSQINELAQPRVAGEHYEF
jgi:hypothetical protein